MRCGKASWRLVTTQMSGPWWRQRFARGWGLTEIHRMIAVLRGQPDYPDRRAGVNLALSDGYVEVSPPVEIAFNIYPGEVFSGRVETVVQAVATGQAQVSWPPPPMRSSPPPLSYAYDSMIPRPHKCCPPAAPGWQRSLPIG
ncbi:hypothetical protein C7476_12170 [Phyllobacterium bourgognense]|uniref:Uncharacterized protein n=1 Tax=Phyllobacterium bourgognense TaxID=314236 RepID=A0A368YL55_9HYPH|nr:hypothetical protein C7476_12170 [Phyllobacterium bourgognense]